MTRFVQTVFKYSTPVIYLVSKNPKMLKVNIPLVQYPRVMNAAAGTKFTVGDFIAFGNFGYNTERLANIILGLPVGEETDTLPKRLTDEEQVPGDKRTKVPLHKMKNVYYAMRGWKDGAPTMKTLKKVGVRIPECIKEVYPYGKG